tara:strand:+ start:546 stop:941 length:396 start_codon:yes stop_codon:yes gene_type:complete
MYYISKNDNDIVEDVYSNTVYLPSDIPVYSITDEEFQQINADGQNGNWKYIDGKLIPYVSAEQNKQTATKLLELTDWTTIADVGNSTMSNPFLSNQDEFIAYRNEVRQYAVYPVDGNVNWPVVPQEVWTNS